MAFKCLECGNVFEEGEQANWHEHHPYGMGTASEEFSGCPICRGSYEETKQCEICGGEFLEDELLGGCVCNECVEEYSKDFDTCYNIANQDKQEIKINGLLATIFDTSEIEQILFEFLKKDGEKIDCSEYIEDKDWFAEKLAEEVSK